MNSEKFDIYQMVTDKVLSLLESGVCPWQKPWKTASAMPSNFVSRKHYQGVNAFLLYFAGMQFDCPHFLTYKQARDLGGNVRKGEKGFPVVFWNFLQKKNGAQPAFDAKGKPVMTAFLRYYTVFNVLQCEGLKWEKPALPLADFQNVEKAEAIVSQMANAPKIEHKGSRACYIPVIDKVEMPNKQAFKSESAYYSTLFHELTHSTGHQSRLDRKGITETQGYGAESYAKEELIAEMGAAFLCAHAEIMADTVENSVAYLQGWIAKLKQDNRLVVSAAGHAQKAANHILGIKAEAQSAET